ncbi:hypothetical protein [Wenyingzhuangia sp. 2_MG-2023]|uniref:hypothetical protein n=1 Tax=Wenyingzhuangia sp. 2_MG-2023 TaxID=3062639 RepID=UPI0026E280D8|nr:hypothetical protein [Wenyingzhuangia sp. 2_MG-2023]MDO6737390.1 hypothetical protein [Wenyingzhuangia sp. 2_MG-2023]
MKTFILLIVTIMLLNNDLIAQSKEKETVKKQLETIDGVRYDFKIKFTLFEVEDITVGDSLKILKENFKKNKTSKIEAFNKSIASYNKKILEQDQKTGIRAISAKALKELFTKEKTKYETKLQEVESWQYQVYKPYTVKDTTEILNKYVKTHFTALKPGEKTESLYKGEFILDKLSEKCLKSRNLKKVKVSF